MLNFNARLKQLRKQKNFTQKQLAEYMGVSPQAVSRWETGVTSPDIYLLPLLAELFNITTDELLGINEKEKELEIDSVINEATEKINQNITKEPIINLRKALNKYPNNDRLLCCLMYALYVASVDENLCKEYDSEIISIANRIQQYSTDDNCRNESKSWLFRHYCDTGRKAEALQISTHLAPIETSYERNFYWALEGKDRLAYLKDRMQDDLKYLLWDIWAYTTHAELSEDKRKTFYKVCEEIESAANKLFQQIK